MTPFGKILIIDDDPQWVKTYINVLGREGYVVESAADGATALKMLDRDPEWGVILLDMRLRGGAGPNDGLDLISEVQVRAPFAKIIMVTGFADAPQPVKDAFAAGVYDFMAKDGPQFQALLLAKVRNALELVRERRIAALGPDERDAAILTTYQKARTEPNSNRKGALLEELMVLLFKSIPGFGGVELRRRNEIEEIDLWIPNESRDPLWQKEGVYLLGECKNWSSAVGRDEFDTFHAKLRRRFGRCRLGFFISLGGFTEPFGRTLTTYSTEDIVIVPIGPEDLANLVQARDRNEELKKLYQRAVIAANGKH